jgi:hypothetical protein
MNDAMNFYDRPLHNVKDKILVENCHAIPFNTQFFIIWNLAEKGRPFKPFECLNEFFFKLFGCFRAFFYELVENLKIIPFGWPQNTDLITVVVHLRRARANLALERRRNSAIVIPLSPEAADCFASSSLFLRFIINCIRSKTVWFMSTTLP